LTTTPPLPDAVTPTSVPDRLFIALQYVLPQHLATAFIHWLARVENPLVRKALIRGFLKLYPQVELGEAVRTEVAQYASFNDFFTRELRPGTRPIDAAPEAIVSPVDGRVSQAGPIDGNQLLQAKGHGYTVEALLGSAARAAAFAGGRFATIYLAPFNYHRIHMPLAGVLREAVHVPGALFSVNQVTAENVPGLFARNERVVCLFDTPHGPLAMVLVGALFVGSMSLAWHPREVTPASPRPRYPTPVPMPSPAPSLARGEEMGRFNMGSTVILLLPPGMTEWEASLVPGRPLRLGERIGTLRTA
jgi:phosphatidylserine decarboxylase